MTYKESYLEAESPENIIKKANYDMVIASMFNPDRLKVIRQSAEDAIKEKFGTDAYNKLVKRK